MKKGDEPVTDEISLEDILRQLYAMSGILIDVYNLEGRSIARYPDDGAAFCHLVCRSPEGAGRCSKDNREAFDIVRREHRMHIYQCHMGLYEAVFPLYHYGRLAGYMMTGQMLEKREGAEEEAVRKARRLRLGSEEEIRKAVDGLVRIDLEERETFVTMCRVCADYIANHHQFPVNATGTAREIVRYLDEHYREDITLDSLCRWFGYSKTRLNQLFREYTGTSVCRYLMDVRMENACRMLRGSGESIYSIAMETGFSSQNYFSRQFKKYIGCTPGEYRKAKDRERREQ